MMVNRNVTRQDIKQALENIIENGEKLKMTKHITIMVGEPLHHPDIVELTAHIEKLGGGIELVFMEESMPLSGDFPSAPPLEFKNMHMHERYSEEFTPKQKSHKRPYKYHQ